MNILAIKVGKYSGITLFILYIIYTIGLTLSFVFKMPTDWTNLSDFFPRVSQGALLWYTITQISALLLGPIYLAMFCGLHDITENNKKILTRFSLLMLTITTVLACFLFFVHFNTLRVFHNKGPFEGMNQFIEWNLDSVISFLGFLGWSIFAGIAVLIVIPTIDIKIAGRTLIVMSWLFGLSSFIGFFGYMFGIVALSILYIFGSTFFGMFYGLYFGLYFKKIENKLTTISS